MFDPAAMMPSPDDSVWSMQQLEMSSPLLKKKGPICIAPFLAQDSLGARPATEAASIHAQAVGKSRLSA